MSEENEVEFEITAKHVEFKTNNNMLHNDFLKGSREELHQKFIFTERIGMLL